MIAAPTRDEILAELRKAQCPVEDGLTTREVAAALKVSEAKASRMIGKWILAGEWEFVRVERVKRTGVICPQPGYRPVKRGKR